MATKKNAKRPEREKIRDQQAYASMEIAIWEHQEAQHSKRVVKSTSVLIREENTWNHTPLASELKHISISVESSEPALAEPVQSTPERAISSQSTAVSTAVSGNAPLDVAIYPHEWMKRAASESAKDMSLFLLIVLFLFILFGVVGH